jgi:DNA repair protein SbcD/Mre11
MVKILHTSDWHLGKRLERFSRREEQVAVLNEICEIADREEVDIVLVAGDLFDNANPPAESVDLFYKTLKRLADNGKRAVLAIAGNHDMPERIEAPDPLARECGIIFSGFPETTIVPFSLEQGFSISRSEPGFVEIQLPRKPPVRILVTPYANEMRLRKSLSGENSEEELRRLLSDHWKNLAGKYCDTQGVNLLVTHLLFMAEGEPVPEEPDDERPINYIGGAQAIFTSSIPIQVQYTALGHLHRFQYAGKALCPVVYCGSPLSYSFSEAGQKKYVVIASLEPGEDAVLKLSGLHSGRTLERRRFNNMDAAKSWLASNPDTLVELTLVSDSYLSGTDRRELNEIHNGIVAIIPEIKEISGTETSITAASITGKSLNELFREYFINKKGQEPGQEILDVFGEILGEEDPET